MTEITENDPTTQRAPSVAPKMILVLGLAGLLSGLLIVVVYVFTLPLITANRARALRAAVFEVVPGASALQALVDQDGELVVAAEDSDASGIYAAYDDQGSFVGYAIPGQGVGYQDVIRLIYGFDPQARHVIGMKVLESKETPGLGDKIIKDEVFLENFRALAIAPEIVLVKHGTKTSAHEVDGITGATISSKAVVKILNTANNEWLPRTPEPGSEPPLQVKVRERRPDDREN
jgi:electron transport complex protein RnfG